MISKKLEKALNDQIALEADAHFRYLAMASWCEKKGLHGAAKFFYGHSEEEKMHMMKIFQYVNEVDGHAIVPAIKKPDAEYDSIFDVVQKALKSEQAVTKAVNKLTELADAEKDYATLNFVQFFVDEQREEETLFTHVIEKMNLIGKEGMGLYYIDKELEGLTSENDA